MKKNSSDWKFKLQSLCFDIEEILLLSYHQNIVLVDKIYLLKESQNSVIATHMAAVSPIYILYIVLPYFYQLLT